MSLFRQKGKLQHWRFTRKRHLIKLHRGHYAERHKKTLKTKPLENIENPRCFFFREKNQQENHI